MGRLAIIEELEQEYLKPKIEEFYVGDTVKVSIKIVEGSKERVQVYTGIVIGRKGTGLSETVSVRRVAYGEGMERVFLLHSPRVMGIEVIKEGDVRQAKLYYLRGTTGKAAKVKQRQVLRKYKKKNKQSQEVFVEPKQEASTPEVKEEVKETSTPENKSE